MNQVTFSLKLHLIVSHICNLGRVQILLLMIGQNRGSSLMCYQRMNQPRICLPAQFNFDDLFLGRMTLAINLYLLWTRDRPFISQRCHADVQEEQRRPCSIYIWGCSPQVTSMSGWFSPSAAWMTSGSPTLNARLWPINTFREFVG